LLPAIGYGDAAGLPSEGKTVYEIQQLYGEITQLVAPTEHPLFTHAGRGATSDDTQLSLATAWSLIAEDDVSLTSLRDIHIEMYELTPRVRDGDSMRARGWGGATVKAVERMTRGVSPLESGEKGSAGNGVVMKMGPLAVWQAFRDIDTQTRHEQYDMFTTMTHDSEIARVCTRLHGDVLLTLMNETESLPEVVCRYTDSIQNEFIGEADVLRRAVTRPCRDAAELAQRYADGKTGTQYGFYAPETLAIAYDIFLGTKGVMNIAVYRAANLGGDSDSVASIVAAMSVCATGDLYKEQDEIQYVQGVDVLRSISQELSFMVPGNERGGRR
jgi:ADP-ribosylglycohydrolase